MYSAGVMLMLTLVSIRLLSGLYARYTTNDSALDSARVARFGITGGGFNQTISLDDVLYPGKTLDYTGDKGFLITNKSEVSVRYIVTIRDTTRNLPLTLTVDKQDETSAFMSDKGYSFTKTLGPNTTAGERIEFKIEWSSRTNSVEYSGQLDNIAITVTAVQVD